MILIGSGRDMDRYLYVLIIEKPLPVEAIRFRMDQMGLEDADLMALEVKLVRF